MGRNNLACAMRYGTVVQKHCVVQERVRYNIALKLLFQRPEGNVPVPCSRRRRRGGDGDDGTTQIGKKFQL